MKAMLFSLLILAFSVSTLAEYRAYRLGIKYHPEDPSDEEKEVITSLDHLQYETYFKITANQQTRLISHWMCYGRTDYHTPYCSEPPKKPLDPVKSPDSNPELRSPASTNPTVVK